MAEVLKDLRRTFARSLLKMLLGDPISRDSIGSSRNKKNLCRLIRNQSISSIQLEIKIFLPSIEFLLDWYISRSDRTWPSIHWVFDFDFEIFISRSNIHPSKKNYSMPRIQIGLFVYEDVLFIGFSCLSTFIELLYLFTSFRLLNIWSSYYLVNSIRNKFFFLRLIDFLVD